MSERTEIVKTCDVCGKRVSDDGHNYIEQATRLLDYEQHAFHGWLKLDRVDSKRSQWDLCSIPCLTKLTMERLSSPAKETLL